MTNLNLPPAPISAQAMADLLCTMVVLCRGVQGNGVPLWAYLSMKPSMAEPLRDAYARGGFDLEDFGTIMEWGEGEQVPEEVSQRMNKQHNLDPDYQSKIIQSLNEKIVSNG